MPTPRLICRFNSLIQLSKVVLLFPILINMKTYVEFYTLIEKEVLSELTWSSQFKRSKSNIPSSCVRSESLKNLNNLLSSVQCTGINLFLHCLMKQLIPILQQLRSFLCIKSVPYSLPHFGLNIFIYWALI